MATDHVCVEWHLTPRGWVQGNWSINKPLAPELTPPDDRVETWVKSQTTPNSDFSRTQIQWSLTWTSPEHSEADRQTLRANTRYLALDCENPPATSWDFPLE